mmetsp:Transcript_33044/g.106876  ORF Transcript_33044/g.106876 Transcript_33044/m.106876 type:complete len:327 (+) Transcript_33044:472-1452(+)
MEPLRSCGGMCLDAAGRRRCPLPVSSLPLAEPPLWPVRPLQMSGPMSPPPPTSAPPPSPPPSPPSLWWTASGLASGSRTNEIHQSPVRPASAGCGLSAAAGGKRGGEDCPLAASRRLAPPHPVASETPASPHAFRTAGLGLGLGDEPLSCGRGSHTACRMRRGVKRPAPTGVTRGLGAWTLQVGTKLNASEGVLRRPAPLMRGSGGGSDGAGGGISAPWHSASTAAVPSLPPGAAICFHVLSRYATLQLGSVNSWPPTARFFGRTAGRDSRLDTERNATSLDLSTVPSWLGNSAGSMRDAQMLRPPRCRYTCDFSMRGPFIFYPFA